MDKIKLLQSRREQVLAAGTEIRKTISSLIDENSFVELSGFSFSKNEFFDAEAEGEGVVTGFATIDGYPVYIAAQNFAVLHGGVSKAGCEKMLRMLSLAEKNSTPVVYILHSRGVQIGEGVTALEGLAQLLGKAAKLHGVVPQFAVVGGEVYGQSAMLAACADFTFFLKEGVLAADSPLVISAKSGKNLSGEQVGGAAALAHTGLISFAVDSISSVRENIRKILDVLPDYSGAVVENGADLNAAFPSLDEHCTADALLEAVFDEDTAVEVGGGSPEVRCFLGRVGGISVAAVLFDAEEGVLLDADNVAKITDFAEFASYYSLPFVTFADTCGIRPDLAVNDSRVLKNCFKLLETYDLIESAKIDGASHYQTFWRLVAPMSMPAIAAFATLQFLWVWNDLLIARLFLGGGSNTTVIVALQQLLGTQGQGAELLTAGAFLSMLLPLIVFFSLQNFLVRGMTAGSVKG